MRGYAEVLEGSSVRPWVTALVGGEALPAELAADLLGCTGAAFNVYGPTETTVWQGLPDAARHAIDPRHAY